MSGSIKNFIYTTDTGQEYAVRLDESNGEAGGFIDVTTARSEGLPRNIKMRYVNAQHPTVGASKRRFYIGTLDFFNQLKSGTQTLTTPNPIEGETGSITWVITSFRGESIRFYSGTDTGLNDGDAT